MLKNILWGERGSEPWDTWGNSSLKCKNILRGEPLNSIKCKNHFMGVMVIGVNAGVNQNVCHKMLKHFMGER